MFCRGPQSSLYVIHSPHYLILSLARSSSTVLADTKLLTQQKLTLYRQDTGRSDSDVWAVAVTMTLVSLCHHNNELNHVHIPRGSFALAAILCGGHFVWRLFCVAAILCGSLTVAILWRIYVWIIHTGEVQATHISRVVYIPGGATPKPHSPGGATSLPCVTCDDVTQMHPATSVTVESVHWNSFCTRVDILYYSVCSWTVWEWQAVRRLYSGN